jgi:hypothetical protein
MRDVGIFYGHLARLRSFGLFYGQLVYCVVIWNIFPIWYVAPRKIWQSCAAKSALLYYPSDKTIILKWLAWAHRATSGFL